MRLITTAGPPPLQLTPQTRFQQNYRIATAVNAGSDAIAIRNGRGDVELFTVGSDNTVWNFYADPASDTGYSGVSTGLQAGKLGAGVDPSGNIILFTTLDLQLWFVEETSNPSSRWTPPVQVSMTLPGGATKIAAIETRQIGGQLYVAALTKANNAIGAVYNLSYAIWDSSNPTLQPTSVNFTSTNCVWLGQNAQSAAFACIDSIIASYSVATGAVTQLPMNGTFHSLSVDAAPDNTGNDQIVAILADTNAYLLTGGTNNQPYSWTQLSQGRSFRQIAAVTAGGGSVEILAVSGDNRLYHWQPLTSSPTGYSDPPFPIGAATATMAVAANDDGDVDVFAVGTAHNTLSHIFQQEASSDWTAEALEVPTNGSVEQYISYSTDLTFADAAGALLPNMPVTVSASEETRVMINGATYFLDPHMPVSISTNGAAMLSFAQEAGGLAVPDLSINVPSLMAPGSSIALSQATVTQAQLQRVTGTELLEAVDANGNPVLGPQYHNQQTADDVAAAVQKCMALIDTPSAHPALLSRHAQADHGVWYRTSGSATDLRGRIAPATEQHWQLSFAGGGVSYRELTRDDAAALIAFKRAAHPDAFGVFDWIEDVGDFVSGVVSGVIDVIDAVVTTVGNAVQAAFTFIVDGVTSVFNTIVETVEQAFDFVQMVFTKIKVFFEVLFLWLGFLFDWPDMVRTHEAIAYAINQVLLFLQGAAGGMQQIFDNGIETLQSQLATLFNNAVQSIAGSATIGGYEQQNAEPSPQLSSSTSNTIIRSAILDNVGGATLPASLQAAIAGDGPFDQFIDQLLQFAGDSAAGPAFESAVGYFVNLGGSVDQIFGQLLSGLMQVVQGMLQLVLSGVKAVVDSLFQLIQSLVAAVQSMLNEEWNIPFVSELYEWITGSSLTTLDLVALLIAIPTTIVYKIEHDSVPFPDEGSVSAFRSSFSAQTMLKNSGLGGTTTGSVITAAPAGSSDPPDPTPLLTVCTAVSTIFYGGFTAVIDGMQEGAPKALSTVAYVLELAMQACSSPWLTSSVVPDPGTADGSAAVLWLVGCLGCGIDGISLARSGRFLENMTDEKAVVAAFLYGCGQLAVSIVASLHATKTATANYIISSVPSVSKILLLSEVRLKTGGTSAIVVGVLDAICYSASAVLGAAGGSSSSPSLTEPLLVTA